MSQAWYSTDHMVSSPVLLDPATPESDTIELLQCRMVRIDFFFTDAADLGLLPVVMQGSEEDGSDMESIDLGDPEVQCTPEDLADSPVTIDCPGDDPVVPDPPVVVPNHLHTVEFKVCQPYIKVALDAVPAGAVAVTVSHHNCRCMPDCGSMPGHVIYKNACPC